MLLILVVKEQLHPDILVTLQISVQAISQGHMLVEYPLSHQEHDKVSSLMKSFHMAVYHSPPGHQ